MPIWKHIRAVVLLPVTVTIVIPAVILVYTGRLGRGNGLPEMDELPFPMLGVVYAAIGIALLVKTIALFMSEGEGTLAQWNPTRKLVVAGIYRRVRNPMISGVLFILLGEATFLGSKPLLIWFVVFFIINAIYIPLVEERDLEKRFGEHYVTYKENVPRWIPSVRPWDPD